MCRKIKSEIFVVFVLLAVAAFFTASPKVEAQSEAIYPVGGAFLPGAFDIFTPLIIPPTVCGLVVNVVGPNPGEFLWVAPMTYDNFYKTPFHVGVNMVGAAPLFPTGDCPPVLLETGSSFTPGF